jgi:hypothetical protein
MQKDSPVTLSNASIGSHFSDIVGDIHFGNETTTYIQNNTDDLILRIQKYLDLPDLGVHFRNLFSGWIEKLNMPGGVQHAAEIRYKFTQEEGKLLNAAKEKNDKLKIWLDRAEQKSAFYKCISRFYEQGGNGTFIFCITGNATDDCIEDVSEMLQRYYFNDIIKNSDNENLIEKRIYTEIYLLSSPEIQDTNKLILSELLGVSRLKKQDILIQELEEKHPNKHILALCKMCAWKEDILAEFFNFWLTSIKRNIESPLFLIVEFTDTDFERLNPFIEAKFKNTSVALLPKLGKVRSVDLDVFFAREVHIENEKRRYDSIFDRNSLTSQDAPIFYRETINKLQLK